MRRLLFSVMAFLLVLLQTAADADDRNKGSIEGKQAALSALNFMKGNLKNFTASITGQENLKTMKGKEYSVSVRKPVGNGGSIVLQLVNGELYATITSKLSKTYVSAICENGFVSCDFGKWKNCKYFIYRNGNFQPTNAFNQLISCYCVSHGACGFNWSRDWLVWALDKFTRMLNYYEYSHVDNVSSSYARRDFVSERQLKVSGNSLRDEDANLLKIKQNKFVQAYESNPYLNQSNTYECKVQNIPALSPVEKEISCDKVYSILGEDYCLLAKSVSFNTSGHLNNVSVRLYPGQNLVTRIVRDDSDCKNNEKYIKVYKNGTLVQQLSSSREVWACGPNGVVWTAIAYWNRKKTPEKANFSFAFYDRDRGKADATIHLEVFQQMKYKDDSISIHRTGNCSPPSGCRLKEEQICDLNGNCVTTVRNFIRTGNVPLIQRKILESSATGYRWTIYADGSSIVAVNQFGEKRVIKTGKESWFIIKRTYQCDSSSRLDINSSLKRGEEVLDNSYYKDGKAGYSGGFGCISLRNKWICQANGNSYDSQSECMSNCVANISVKVSDSPFLTCKLGNGEGVYVCKVALSGQIRTYGKEKELVPNAIDKGNTTFEFRVCQQEVDDSGEITLKCPVNSGEKVVKNCYCDTSNEAWKSLATLEALNEMSHDIICSQE